MQAFAIEKSGDKEGKLVSLPIPKPSPNHALIKVLRAGVCNTDLEILQGYMGFTGVLGHEFVGRVVEVNTTDPATKDKWLNQRVCGDINVGCASCDICHGCLDGRCSKMGRNHCPNRTVLGILKKNGTMAEYLTLPVSNLHKVPDTMDDATAVFAEPLAAACRIVEQGLVNYDSSDPPDKVAILGDGKLGLMIAEVLGREHAKRLGQNNNHPRPVMFGKHQHKLDLVSESGVDCRLVSECIDTEAFSGVAAQHAAKYDVVVDATGSPAGLKLAAGLCRPMGTLVLKSTCAAGEHFNAAPFVIDELKVIGSRCGPIHTALDLLAITKETTEASGLPPLRVEKYVTKTFPLSQAVEAIQCAAEKSTMKVQIICSE
ncbi:L-threonine 3-dehydrogenase [Seminavis robusta]|uniref:L-threonine 3-dehydrogenase n=1 Tax=Seminavis robusta TaxID=568900 RepID=A0A9N8F2F5_9STRA|nr:L-threonine 3-dehydrogenase [Seminavis robusta]|eukprot:Sro2721_g335490.1 L-threonine 3-dehydrogenase (373) ;mRNA; f:2158-3593